MMIGVILRQFVSLVKKTALHSGMKILVRVVVLPYVSIVTGIILLVSVSLVRRNMMQNGMRNPARDVAHPCAYAVIGIHHPNFVKTARIQMPQKMLAAPIAERGSLFPWALKSNASRVAGSCQENVPIVASCLSTNLSKQ
ncbi:MAG: hypothetical protein ACOYU4_05640 [Thermodesulfobacteriota bacterium]